MGWTETEFETLDLGDLRLNRRAIYILESIGLAPGRTIPQSFKSRAEIKACYNFFDNDLVSDEKILLPHTEKTIERIREYPVVLLPSDTTEIDYTAKEAMEGRERLSNKKKGLWLHSTLAVTPDRLTLGVVDAHFWHRQPEVSEDSSTYRTARDKAPIEEKESYRWLQSYQKACELAREVPETKVINITDREGDMIEIFEEAEEQKKQGSYAYFIIRSQYNRLLIGEDIKNNNLWDKLKATPPLGEIEFTIPPTEKRKGRKVKQEFHAVSVTVASKRKKLKVKINAIMAIEKEPPEGEKPLIWSFVTNLPIDSFDDVSNIISYYLCRWEIELFFKVLKSGCKIEERQLQTTERMKSLIAIFMVLSWRVMFTMMLGRVSGEMSCAGIFEDAEWKSVCKILNKKKSLPRTPPSLGKFVIMVATLGGYVPQKNGEPPGVKTMWKGMARMIDFAIAWDAFGR
jgi:hypothetical protein